MKQSGFNTTFAAAGGVVALVAMIAFLAPEKHVSAAYSNPAMELTANASPALQSMSTSVLIKAANAGTDSSITVPTGKRLVIEYISAQATTDEGQRLQDVLVETTTQGVGGKSGIPTVGVYPVQNGTLNGKPNWVVSQPILAYADAGTVTLQADVTGGSASVVAVTVSGHYVNIQ
jgi:hypothetical protein